MRILVFGDSITQGFTDPEGGWVQHLSRPYVEHLLQDPAADVPYVFNVGISGDTSRDVLARFESEVKVRIWRNEPIAIVIAVGVNDACIENGEPRVPAEEYRRNIEQLIALSRKFSDKLLLVGLTPCVESRTNPCAWDDSRFNNQDIGRLNDILREVCAEQKAPLVHVMDLFSGREETLLPDGLHPNTEGHKRIADVIRPELEKLLTD